MKKILVQCGDSYGRLSVIKEMEPRICKSRSVRVVLCECDCGEVKGFLLNDLRQQNTLSCGCLNSERVVERNTSHGLTGHELYSVWQGMKDRCNNQKSNAYKDYGGRGIKICEEWNDFKTFMDDMGPRPFGYTLERMDNDSGYGVDNCKWATRATQANNQRSNHIIEYDGAKMTATQWSEKLGGNKALVRHRINTYGWDHIRAVTTPIC